MEVEPVAVVPVTDADASRHAFRETIARGNPVVAAPTRENYPEPVTLKYAGVKTWAAYARGTANWHINEKNGLCEIIGTRKGRYGAGWRILSSGSLFLPGQASRRSLSA
jgi:hypothetical protein